MSPVWIIQEPNKPHRFLYDIVMASSTYSDTVSGSCAESSSLISLRWNKTQEPWFVLLLDPEQLEPFQLLAG